MRIRVGVRFRVWVRAGLEAAVRAAPRRALVGLEWCGARLQVEPSPREVTSAQRELVIPPAHLCLVGPVGRIAVDRPDEVPRGLAHLARVGARARVGVGVRVGVRVGVGVGVRVRVRVWVRVRVRVWAGPPAC